MRHPDTTLVLAPMAGGAGSVDLAVAVAEVGGLAFLPAGYLTVDRLRRDVETFRARTREPFGVNVFVPQPDRPELHEAATGYAARLDPMAELAGVGLGEPRWSDDAYADKLDLLVGLRPDLVSFTFGWPDLDVVERLHAAEIEVWVTVNDPAEADWATELGVDGLVAQGWEAGGHRGGPVDTGEGLSTAELVSGLEARLDPGTAIVAAGGLMTGADGRAMLDRGADAAAYGTAFLASDEAATAPVHRHALTHREGTVVTRGFTGRSARALHTSWTDIVGRTAPAAYPHIHFVTAPLRAYGKAAGVADLVNLWAGTGHAQARTGPAARIAADLLADLP